MATCSSCGAEVEWVTMRETGKAMPLDVGTGSNVTGVDVRADGGDPFGVAVTLRRSHFATCPNADQHRKAKGPSPTSPPPFTPALVRIVVDDDELREGLMRPVVGDGGFQRLLRGLRTGAEWRFPNGRLERLPGPPAPATRAELVAVFVGAEDLDRLVRYAHAYGEGGFQGRLRSLLVGLAPVARALAPLATPPQASLFGGKS